MTGAAEQPLKIAIAAVLFDDTSRIGSQRGRAFSRELARLGNEVTVFTEGDPQDTSSPFEGVRVVRLGAYSSDLWPKSAFRGLVRKALVAVVIAPTVLPLATLKRKRSARARHQIQRLTQQRQSSVQRLDLLLSAQIWTQAATQRVRQDFPRDSFDVAFSTFDPLGRALRDGETARKWVADFRDPAVSDTFLPAVRAYLQKYQDRIMRDADWVTTVSHGFEQLLTASHLGQRAASRVAVLTNGFTPRASSPAPSGTAPLRIAYTGALYDQQVPELALLLRIMKSLTDAGHPIELLYAGRHSAWVLDEARKVGAEDLVRDSGLLTHEEALALQDDADALLVLSWNQKGQGGVLPGKFLEYLGGGRPILAMVAGEAADSELSQLTQRLRVGVCFEQAEGLNRESQLRDWLLEASELRASGLPLPFTPDAAEVDKFSYGNLAQRLQKVLRRVAGPLQLGA